MKNASSTLSRHPFWGLFKFEFSAQLSQLAMFALFLTVPLWTQLITSRHLAPTSLAFDFVPSSNEFYLMFFSPILLATLFAIGPLGKMPQGSLDFIFTRAVNRKLVFRAKSFIYLGFVCVPLLAVFCSSFIEPDVTMHRFPSHTERLGERQDHYLQVFPGSYAKEIPSATPTPGFVDSEIHVPWGNVWMAAWSAWRILLVAVLVETIAIWTIQRRKYLGKLRYAIVFLFPLVLVFLRLKIDPGNDWMNEAFIFFRTHPLVLWVGLLLCLIPMELYGEHQFEQLEVL